MLSFIFLAWLSQTILQSDSSPLQVQIGIFMHHDIFRRLLNEGIKVHIGQLLTFSEQNKHYFASALDTLINEPKRYVQFLEQEISRFVWKSRSSLSFACIDGIMQSCRTNRLTYFSPCQVTF